MKYVSVCSLSTESAYTFSLCYPHPIATSIPLRFTMVYTCMPLLVLSHLPPSPFDNHNYRYMIFNSGVVMNIEL